MRLLTLIFGYVFLGSSVLAVFTLLSRAMFGKWSMKNKWLDIVVMAGIVVVGFIAGGILLLGARP
ncbi:hypothetical protein E3J62_01110 [candidate division TA06 bacterium]|uniref:Uncharacterized protein n=1 Tax=candidate division TA06 bacterium TaxID=2250710 RepID=A0A523UYH8_UNCT6|nr:MAG: hypothetical protein E3J62_01110 [candidate division TA06 bacterium]